MHKEKKKRLGLRKKITLILSLSLFCIITLGCVFGYYFGFRLLDKTISTENGKIAQTLSAAFNRIINEEILDVEIFMSHPLRRKAIIEANKKYENMNPEDIAEYMSKMDSVWASTPEGNPPVSDILNTPESARLRELVNADSNLVELFLTDRYGGLVFSSAKTSDFYQADEQWWQRTYNQGTGKN